MSTLTRLCQHLPRTRLLQSAPHPLPVLRQKHDFADGGSPKKRGRKTTKKFTDLPNTYLNADGAPVTPLPEWNPDYAGTSDAKSKPTRKSRKVIQEDTIQAPSSTVSRKITDPAKAPRPTSFLAKEILSNLRRFPHCLLLTRVGQFYESYFDQAAEIARLLNIKLTSRKWNGQRVAMCGFPIIHLDRHLKTLVQQENRFVAMCEEFPRYLPLGGKEFERRISRIITPGTLIDETFLDPLSNNYLLAISPSKADDNASSSSLGLAWIDVATGEFYSKQCGLESISDELARLSPREIVLDSSWQQEEDHLLLSLLKETGCVVSYCTQTLDPFNDPPSQDQLAAHLGLELQHHTPTLEAHAIDLLTIYLRKNLLEHMPVLTPPRHEEMQGRMQIDAHTIQGLEIRETVHHGGVKGSLLSVIKRTTTNGGARLLARLLCSPSTSVAEINSRQTLVAFFHRRAHFRADVCEILKELEDIGRVCQRFLLGRADVGDLVAVKTTIETWSSLLKRCQYEKETEDVESGIQSHLHASEWDVFNSFLGRLSSLQQLSKKIAQSINTGCDDLPDVGQDDNINSSETPERIGNKWTINPMVSQKLSRIHALLGELQEQKSQLEAKFRLEYDAPSLTLRSSPGQSFHVHLARAKRDKKKVDSDGDFYSIGESQTTKTYYHRAWTVLGGKIVEAEIAFNAAGKEVFDELRLEVIESVDQLRANAEVIDQLDVAISFALLADEMNFVRPEIVEESGVYHVLNGRHATVETGLLASGRQFTPNSVEMKPSANLHIITGPNMAGKSTLLRQTALIAILAQVGSFVPADSARIGVVDKLFSRIGAKDDLFRDRSTFMVEMLETSDILRRATDKSLVIMDEVGRGTTVKDGLAIAFAAVHHLATVTKCRTLFATHFHELAEMLGQRDDVSGSGAFENVRFFCTDVDSVEDDRFAYSYRLHPGINRDSHGLKVARLAGMPASTVAVAMDTLAWLKQHGTDKIQSKHAQFLEDTLQSVSS